ncbi:MAG: hypothetical protein Q9157_003130 [Trypethelium eluteriae]
MDVPTIDFAPFLRGGREDREAIAKTVDSALSSVGLIYVKNHGIPDNEVNEAFSWLQRFFALPNAKKRTVQRYREMGREIIRSHPSRREALNLANPSLDMSADQWPTEEILPGFRDFMESFWQNCARLLHQLIDCVSLALELPEEHSLSKCHSRSCFSMGCSYYPETLITHETGPRMGAHSDSCTLTLLFQDPTGGLELGDRASVQGKVSAANFEQRGGTYKPIDFREGMVLVNVGYVMGRYSNGRYKSTIHRVGSPDVAAVPGRTETPDRYSIAFFGDPDPGTIADALPGTYNPENPKRWGPLNIDEYLGGIKEKTST